MRWLFVYTSSVSLRWQLPLKGKPWGRYKKYPAPDKIRGGIQSIPRFHPGYSRWLSLIDALTGAPDRAFLPYSSEVVSRWKSNKALSPNRPLSGKFCGAHVFITAFYQHNITQFPSLVNPAKKLAAQVEGISIFDKLFHCLGEQNSHNNGQISLP